MLQKWIQTNEIRLILASINIQKFEQVMNLWTERE